MAPSHPAFFGMMVSPAYRQFTEEIYRDLETGVSVTLRIFFTNEADERRPRANTSVPGVRYTTPSFRYLFKLPPRCSWRKRGHHFWVTRQGSVYVISLPGPFGTLDQIFCGKPERRSPMRPRHKHSAVSPPQCPLPSTEKSLRLS
jgi:hypothetical protein